jgi:hypothetical protein
MVDWNHQGIWAIGAAVAGGVLGVVGTQISTSSAERLADIPFAERVKAVELRLDETETSLAGVRGDLQAQETQIAGLSGGGTEAGALAALTARIDDITRRLEAVEKMAATAGKGADPEAVARILAEQYADRLRGPKGDPGPVTAAPATTGEEGGGAATAAATTAIETGANEPAVPAAPEIVGPLDCFELSGRTFPLTQDFVQGGAVCLDGGQAFAITGASGCLVRMEGADGVVANLNSGQQAKIEHDGRTISVALQCDPSVRAEDGKFLYRLRLSVK